MPVNGESSKIAQHIRLRQSRNPPKPISYSDPTTTNIPCLIQSTRCKSSISSLLLSTFSSSTTTTTTSDPTATTIDATITTTYNKKKNIRSTKFRGLGCAASPQVSVPGVIRTSADWQAKKLRKKKQKKNKTHPHQHPHPYQDVPIPDTIMDPPPPAAQPSASSLSSDVWCGPGIGFSAADASVDCVVSKRNAGRGKIDGGEKMNQRERSCSARRTMSKPEQFSVPNFDPSFGTSRHGSDIFGGRRYRHVQDRTPEGLAEILVLQSSLMLGGRSDPYLDAWRLEIDHLSYEELLALTDKIGYVSTGLTEDEICGCLKKINVQNLPQYSTVRDSKCSICQEEYEAEDELGALNCGHAFHMSCIKEWLGQKKICPFCKTEVAV